MTDSLVAFARTGNPNIPGFRWPVFDPARPQLLELGASAHIGAWPDERKLAFFRDAPAVRSPGGAVRD